MASHDKKILSPWIGKSWEKFRGATTPGGVISPGDVDELGGAVPITEAEPEVAEGFKGAVPMTEVVRPGESTRVTSGEPGVTAEPSSLTELSKSPVPALERAEGPREWDKTIKAFRGRVKAEMAKEKPTFTNEIFGDMETVPEWYRVMDMAGAGKPGHAVAMDSKGNITVGTPSGRTISTRPGAALEDAQQKILDRVNYLQNTPVEKQYQDYLAENKRQYPKGTKTTKLNEWGTTAIEGEPLDFETFKKDIPARIDAGLGSLERLSGTKKESPPTDYLSAVPKPFEFSSQYQELYGNVARWSQRPGAYKKELAVAIPLLERIAKNEIEAYKASALPEIWKTQVTSDIERKKLAESLGLTEAKKRQITAETSAIPFDIEKKKAETEAIKEKIASNPYFTHVMTAAMEEETDAIGQKTKKFNPDLYNQLAPSFGLPELPKSGGGQLPVITLDQFKADAKKKRSKFSGKELEEKYKAGLGKYWREK